MKFENGLFLLIFIALISGCASAPSLPIVDDNEAFKYERKYLAEYEQLKSNFSDTSTVKWVQAKNKKTACKIYVGISKDNDRTLDENYTIYWDGACKNGYANGLGREFERGTVLNMEALAIYQGKQQKPQYFINTYYLDNKVQEGDINNGYYVETTINEDNFNFDVAYKYGYFDYLKMPALITHSSPFNDTVMYTKSYLNYHYQLYDFSRDEFQNTKYAFYMLNQSHQRIGFGFETPKNGAVSSGEYSNGNVLRLVKLPQSFFNNANAITSEVKQAGQQAINSQKKALQVKKQYMNRICKQSVTVNFIDNVEYKRICNDSEYFSSLKEKMNAKLAQINESKQQKREQLNQQKLINAQVNKNQQMNQILSNQQDMQSEQKRVKNELGYQKNRDYLCSIGLGYGCK
jgi:hypothetical protein